jgi:DNA-binding LacI/PurR family transcriptional regulator
VAKDLIPQPASPPAKAGPERLPQPRVTQRDIARQANVSHVTVSLALRGDPAIPDRTRRRIQQIADALGYAPDPMLMALSSYRKLRRPAAYQANIAWLTENPHPANSIQGDFGLYFQGAAARARELGYVLEEISLIGENQNPTRLRRLLEARSITGLLLAPSWVTGRELKFDLSRYSAVRLGYSYRSPILNTVANSQFRTALTSMQKAIALGYQRVGIILTEDVDERTSWHFLGGYLAGQHLLAKENRLAPIYASPNHALAETIHHWVVQEEVDCLIGCGHGELYRALLERGVAIPGRLGYVDMQIPEADEFLSGIHQNARQIGRAAVDLLVSMMHQHTTGLPAAPTHLLIEGSWHAGKTAVARRTGKPELEVSHFSAAITAAR